MCSTLYFSYFFRFFTIKFIFSGYEKAKLVMEVEAANTTVADLTIQLNQVTKSLEQTRSRLSAYEGKR